MDTNQKQKGQFWLGMLVSLVCLAAIFLFIEPTEIVAALETAHWGYLGLTAVGILLYLFFRAVRWRFMLENDVALGQAFHIQNIGYMLNMLLPFRLGDIAQAILIGNVPPVTVARGLSTVVMPRILDLMFMVLLLPLTLAATPAIPPNIQSAALVTGLGTFVAIVVMVVAANQRPFVRRMAAAVFQRIGRLDVDAWVTRVDDLLAGLSSLTNLKDGLTLTVMTLFVWLPIIFAYWIGLRAVQLDLTWAMSAFVVCAAALSVAAPSSPGQVGVFHAGVIFALTSILAQPAAPAASFAFLYHAVNLVTMIIVGVIGLFATGATFRNVLDATRQFANRKSASHS
ncbi:MAG: flippase-like domain-containing protein [Chloroflexi bacterium]|nr:flippase-like domain-containing protein [Chloroflexota bacterium]